MQVWVVAGHLLFLGLLILSILHFRERVVHVDSALQIYKWVQKDGVEVEAHRYTAVVPQLVVKLLKLTGAGLPTLLKAASAMHVLVGWLIFALAAHVFRVPWVAVACALATLLCTRLTFYGIVLEANYLLSYPFLLTAVVAGPMARKGGTWNLLLGLASLGCVLLVHPLGFLVALYVLIFLFIVLPTVRVELMMMMAIALTWGLFGRSLLPPSGYESGLYEAAAAGWTSPGGISSSPALDFLFAHSWRDTALYLPAWLLFVAAFVLPLLRRGWAIGALVVVGCLGYVLLIAVTYHAGETAMMMEKNLLPLATLIALPLVHEVVSRGPTFRAAAFVPFVLVLFLQFRVIAFAARPAGERYAALSSLVGDLRAQGLRKAIVPEADLQARRIGVVWALPFETLLIAALDGPGEALTAVPEACADEVAGIEGVHLMPWTSELPVAASNKNYFHLPHGPYRYFVNE